MAQLPRKSYLLVHSMCFNVKKRAMAKSIAIKKTKGLTLIEVLIALVITGIAMTALIKATSENIRQTGYLRQKTIALWLAQDVLNQASLGLIKLPLKPDALKRSVSVLGTRMFYSASQAETPNNRIRKIEVSVYDKENTEDENVSPLIHLETYIYREA